MTKPSRAKIAIFAPYYVHVGTERVMLTLAKGFAKRGNEVHLLRAHKEWATFEEGNGVLLVDLKAGHLVDLLPWHPRYRVWNILLTMELLPKLALYIRREQPTVLITGLLGVVGVLARDIAMGRTKVIISVQGLPRPTRIRKFLWKHIYARAEALVFIATRIAERLPQKASAKLQVRRVIYNPVLEEEILQQASETVDHIWFNDGQLPVILGVGRLTRQKDFQTLIKAFALVRMKHPARLVILGEGEQRAELESLARELNVFGDLYMPGFVKNPHKYMARSKVFVLSSRWEGAAHVLIEALGAGVPVVSTDCPHGQREVLLDGEIGFLVPVGNPQAMADAIIHILKDHNIRQHYKRVGLERAQDFYSEPTVEQYLQLIDELVAV